MPDRIDASADPTPAYLARHRRRHRRQRLGLTNSGANPHPVRCNTYSGPTTINAGTLKGGGDGWDGERSIRRQLGVSLANVAGATLDTTVFNNAIGSRTVGGSTAARSLSERQR